MLLKKGSFRSNHRRCSVRKGVLRNFTKFTGKHQVFSCESCKISKNTFLQNTSGRLLLFFLIILFRLFHRPLFVSEVGLSRSKSQTMVAPGNKSITHLTVNYTNKELIAIIISNSSSDSKQCIDTL